MIARIVEKQIQEALGWGYTLIIYGPRQVGKTTLLKKLISEHIGRTPYYDAESANTREYWQPSNVENILDDLQWYDLIGIDEAQKIRGIGSILKYLHDHLPSHIQLIATGSSSFDLAQKTRESMVGRVREFFLAPFTTRELVSEYGRFDVGARLETYLTYGMYPIALQYGGDERWEQLENLSGSLLYKDILEIDSIQKPESIIKLLRLVALQIGNKVSYSELGTQLDMSTVSIQKYLYLLEEAFIIFTLSGFSRNLRNEITRSPKIYFYDVGVRNALINNFNPPSLRTDIWSLWENFIIAEMMKKKRTEKVYRSMHFWRTHTQKEIDYIEDYDGALHAYEIKWNEKKSTKIPKEFALTYPEHTFDVIHPENWMEFFE